MPNLTPCFFCGWLGLLPETGILHLCPPPYIIIPKVSRKIGYHQYQLYWQWALSCAKTKLLYLECFSSIAWTNLSLALDPFRSFLKTGNISLSLLIPACPGDLPTPSLNGWYWDLFQNWHSGSQVQELNVCPFESDTEVKDISPADNISWLSFFGDWQRTW